MTNEYIYTVTFFYICDDVSRFEKNKTLEKENNSKGLEAKLTVFI